MDGEKNGVLPVDDVKSALMRVTSPHPSSTVLAASRCANAETPYRALGIASLVHPRSSPTSRPSSTPRATAIATYEPFFAICALKFHARSHGDADAHRAAVDEAFRLFTNGAAGPITLAHLRRVAAVLKEDVDEELLKDMILEANSGAGVARGVEWDEFDEVMRNAGVWR